jgi:hypothetical protein
MSDGPDLHPRDRLSEYVDDELAVDERAVVDRHLALCEACRAELHAIRLLARAVAADPVPPPPDDLVARIGRGLDAAERKRPASIRYFVPATIAATIAAIGILIAVQWRQAQRPVVTAPPPPAGAAERDERVVEKTIEAPTASSNIGTPARETDRRQAQRPVVTAPPPPAGAAGRDEGVIEKTLQAPTASSPIAAPARETDRRPANGPAGESALAGGTRSDAIQGPVAATVPEAEKAKESAPALDRMALKKDAAVPCGDSWFDSGLGGRWEVEDAREAAARLDRWAQGVGGSGSWNGPGDPRPYRLVVPKPRLSDAVAALRAMGVTGLDAPSLPVEGRGCAAVSIALISPGGP